MSPESHRDLPPSAFEAPAPASTDLALWSADAAAEAQARFGALMRVGRRYLPHAFIALTAVGAVFGAASYATAPALTDGLEQVAAIDARAMGLAANLDATGAQKKTAALGRDVGAMKTEITRLQRALDQARSSQSTQSKTAANQVANSLDEVRGLKSEIASLNKTLEATRGDAAAKIDALSVKVDQSKADEAHLAELRDRLDKVEKTAATRPAARDDGPEVTGSINTPTAGGEVVRNWIVRDVVSGVALLESRSGRMVEVERGARAPGIGRIRSIERRNGEWVVVTDRGAILGH